MSLAAILMSEVTTLPPASPALMQKRADRVRRQLTIAGDTMAANVIDDNYQPTAGDVVLATFILKECLSKTLELRGIEGVKRTISDHPSITELAQHILAVADFQS